MKQQPFPLIHQIEDTGLKPQFPNLSRVPTKTAVPKRD